ncbi:uncharacterized protein isoform X2 [Choristoneura fumiferana]|uniref:uncharacterized protein isoform X2 n=1 Tax=Choristoneura fumiferana TaxID=7141 RepID=UPI003D156D4E
MAEESHNSLRDLLNKIAKERGYNIGDIDVQDISSEGANYSSTLHLATISAPPKEDLKLFAKIANFNEALRASSDMFTKAFETECVFYSELIYAFERLYDKHDVAIIDRLNVSKYYGHESTNNKETLILENLAASGYESFNRFKPLDWDYASAAVSELAKFHALGIAAKEENIEELERIRKIRLDIFAMENMKEVFLNQAIKMGEKIIKEDHRAKVQNYIKEKNMLHDLALLWKPLDAGFLIHGDYRSNNLMHRKKDGKVQIVPLDFQTLHFGPLVVDLIYFIWCGSDAKFRQKHYDQLLRHFYTELTIALQNLHIDINKVYPRKTFEEDLKESKTLGLFLGLSMTPILLVEPEDAPKIDSIQNLALEPNQLALDATTEVVEDYIRWGII